MTEDQICIEFVKTLSFYKLHKKLKCIYIHIPNEISANNNPIYGNRLKMKGKLAGAPDYIFLTENDFGCIEFKTPTGKFTPGQIKFQEKCERYNIKYEVAKSSNEGIDILTKWGFIK